MWNAIGVIESYRMDGIQPWYWMVISPKYITDFYTSMVNVMDNINGAVHMVTNIIFAACILPELQQIMQGKTLRRSHALRLTLREHLQK